MSVCLLTLEWLFNPSLIILGFTKLFWNFVFSIPSSSGWGVHPLKVKLKRKVKAYPNGIFMGARFFKKFERKIIVYFVSNKFMNF